MTQLTPGYLLVQIVDLAGGVDYTENWCIILLLSQISPCWIIFVLLTKYLGSSVCDQHWVTPQEARADYLHFYCEELLKDKSEINPSKYAG